MLARARRWGRQRTWGQWTANWTRPANMFINKPVHVRVGWKSHAKGPAQLPQFTTAALQTCYAIPGKAWAASLCRATYAQDGSQQTALQSCWPHGALKLPAASIRSNAAHLRLAKTRMPAWSATCAHRHAVPTFRRSLPRPTRQRRQAKRHLGSVPGRVCWFEASFVRLCRFCV